jgi:hypothetical protein
MQRRVSIRQHTSAYVSIREFDTEIEVILHTVHDFVTVASFAIFFTF